ncbi:hypothetical protein P8T86_23305 [Paenibacillus larvae]|uniref:hypothetical protein n=1 Tax=Paenibacillus larvae TaxID=1464 RepID=UPI00292E4C5E|nr:hypothetical protein [Paenibacillus larvae]WOC08562.1 hypothetical protein P8T86_23305 [Paenibacillus larvae]
MNQGGMKQDLDLQQDVMQEEFRPEVSVILPVYNESRTLPGVLQGDFWVAPFYGSDRGRQRFHRRHEKAC